MTHRQETPRQASDPQLSRSGTTFRRAEILARGAGGKRQLSTEATTEEEEKRFHFTQTASLSLNPQADPFHKQ